VTTQRLEAFSDGVIAIIITIMVLEIKVPRDVSAAALADLTPIFLAYAFSFVLVAITWVNHHHLIHFAKRTGVALLWANIHLLFWLSLIPFATGYVGNHVNEKLPIAVYGLVLTGCIGAFLVLRICVAAQYGPNDAFTQRHRIVVKKNLAGLALYAASVPLAFVTVYASYAIFVVIPLQYILPQQRHDADVSAAGS
jgi:uncharacterized membrane protein